MEQAGYDYPVASYDHDPPANWSCNSDSGHAISGGLVHRGDLRGLQGKYVFGDLVEGRVFYDRRRASMRDDSGREAPVQELALYDTERHADADVRLRRRRPGGPALRHRRRPATSTCWPRPTG